MSDKPSFIRRFFRAFFGTLSSIFGFVAALFIIFIILASISWTSTSDIEPKTSIAYLPDADGNYKKLSDTSPVILKVNITGVIGGESLNFQKISDQLVDSRIGDLKDNRVKGILLYVDTPGGIATDTDQIYRALKEYKTRYKVPIYAYADGLCASGGMYISCAADKIYASEGSIIGSVGVLMPTFMNFADLLEKIGVKTVTLYQGKGKDDMNPMRPWKPGEDESFKQLLEASYHQFVHIVSSNRPKLDKKQLINDYGANVFIAQQSLEKGYIDEIENSMDTVLKNLVKAAGLEGKEYQFIQLESKPWLFSYFKVDSPLISGRVKHQFDFGPQFAPELMNQFLYLYCPGK